MPPAEPPADPLPLMIDAAALCRALSIGETTLKKLIRTGRLPLKRYRLCRKVLFLRAELEQWIAAGMPPVSRWAMIRERNAGKLGAA